jgi:hypothetical protein
MNKLMLAENKKRRALFNTEIWSAKFIFQDLYFHASEKTRKRIDTMSIKELEIFIRKNLHDWRKCMSYGIMDNWDFIAHVCIEQSENI